MARELAIPCFLARVGVVVAVFAIGSLAQESLAAATEASDLNGHGSGGRKLRGK